MTELDLRVKCEHERRRRSKLAQIEALSGDEKPLWSPQAGPQTDALLSQADELLYGGQAGGGKTHLLLGAALLSHHSSIIFRRELQQMKGAEGIIAQSEQIIGTQGRLNRSEYVWRDLPGGRALEFGSVPHYKDRLKYKGRAHDLKAFDELTEFTEALYMFLIAWNRSTLPHQRCRVIATTNPPTDVEGEWIIEAWAPWLDEEFVDPAAPGELRWYAMIDGKRQWFQGGEPLVMDDGSVVEKRSRTFIPATLEDNAYLRSTGYRARLQNLPEPLRSQLLYGFSAPLAVEDDPWQVIPTAWVRLAQARWRALHEDERFKPAVPMTALGVDPSRGGRDDTVQAPRYGNYLAELVRHKGPQMPDGPTVAAVVLLVLEEGADVVLDGIGIGSSVYDALEYADRLLRKGEVTREALETYFDKVSPEVIDALLEKLTAPSAMTRVSTHLFIASAPTKARDKSGKLGFSNRRAEAWWRMRELLDPSSDNDVALPDDRRLRSDLCAPRYRLTVRGIQIEDKELIKQRLGRSTDDGDATVQAFYEMPRVEPVAVTRSVDRRSASVLQGFN